MVLIKIFVAIISTKLQRSESGENVKKISTMCRRSRLQNKVEKFADLGKFDIVQG